MKTRSISRLNHASAALVLGLLLSAAQPALAQYTFQSLDVPAEWGFFTSTFSINNAGVVVGNFATFDLVGEGVIFTKSGSIRVTVPGVTSSLDQGSLSDVNDLGEAVGIFADDETGAILSYFRSADGEITVLPEIPDAIFVEATGINNAGVIVGFYRGPDFSAHGFILQDGIYTTYDYPGAQFTLLTRINNRGQITGFGLDPDGHRRGSVLQNGTTTTIEVPGSMNTRALGINHHGQVVGYYDDEDFVAHGFLFKNGVYTTLDFPGALDTVLYDINDQGVICGTYDGWSRGLIATPSK
jgi:probable HAF family extracellular repeat protein